jgi:hypothetical protein
MTKRSLACWAVVAGALCVAARGAEAQSVRVTVPALEIRSEPGPNGKVLAQASRGDFLEVVEEASAEWLMVRVPGADQLGFVPSAGVDRIAARPADGDQPGPTTPEQSERTGAVTPLVSPASALPKERLTLLVSAGLAPKTLSASEATSFTMYQEDTGRLATSYKYGRGTDLDATLRYLALAGRLGLQVSYAASRRDGTTLVTAEVPHPLYFGRNRSLTTAPAGYTYSETAIHADVVLAASAGRLRVALLGGVTFFSVEADLLERLQFQQQYPYETDDVTVKSASPARLTSSPTGFNVGGTLDVVLQRHFGLGAQVRYSSATARLVHPASSAGNQDVTGTQSIWPGTTPVELKVGGLQATAGLRLYF